MKLIKIETLTPESITYPHYYANIPKDSNFSTFRWKLIRAGWYTPILMPISIHTHTVANAMTLHTNTIYTYATTPSLSHTHTYTCALHRLSHTFTDGKGRKVQIAYNLSRRPL